MTATHELNVHTPDLLPANLTASANIYDETEDLLLRTTGEELATIVDKLGAVNRAACVSASCALRASCRLVPEQSLEGDNSDPMNPIPPEDIPSYKHVEITCAARSCKEFSRTGSAMEQLSRLVNDAAQTEELAESVFAKQKALGAERAAEIKKPGILEADKILSEAKELAATTMQPYDEEAKTAVIAAAQAAETSKAEVLDQFRESVKQLLS